MPSVLDIWQRKSWKGRVYFVAVILHGKFFLASFKHSEECGVEPEVSGAYTGVVVEGKLKLGGQKVSSWPSSQSS